MAHQEPNRIYNNGVVIPLSISGSDNNKNVTYRIFCSDRHTFTMSYEKWETLPLAPN